MPWDEFRRGSWVNIGIGERGDLRDGRGGGGGQGAEGVAVEGLVVGALKWRSLWEVMLM